MANTVSKSALSKVKTKAKKYLPSVADAYMFDYTTKEMIATAKALTDSSVEITTSENKQRAGQGNAVQFITHTDRDVNVTLTSIEFDIKYFAMQIGTKIKFGKTTLVSGEVGITAKDGKIVMPVKPINDMVYITVNDDYVSVPVSPEDNTADLNQYGVTDECVPVIYLYEGDAQMVDIATDTEPTIVTLMLSTPIYNNAVGEIGALQYTFDKFQFNGNATNSLTAGNTGTFELSGSPIASETNLCEGHSSYGVIKEVSLDPQEIYSVASILVRPSVVEVAVGEKEQLAVYGKKGAESVFDLIEISNELCEFTSADAATATVTATGEITAVAAGDTTVTVVYDGLTAEIKITVTTAA